MVRTAAVTLALVALAAATAPAQSRWEDQVNDQIKTAGKILEERGYTQTHDVYTGQLREGETETLRVTLHAGTQYALIGVCDDDCSDIDLRIFDADDSEVDSDVETDDTPIVQASPTETQQYHLKVIMVTCKANPCWYGIGVYGKPAD